MVLVGLCHYILHLCGTMTKLHGVLSTFGVSDIIWSTLSYPELCHNLERTETVFIRTTTKLSNSSWSNLRRLVPRRGVVSAVLSSDPIY